MSLNETPSAGRAHIGVFGRRNAGKSSVVNALTGQDLSLVSDRPGTTTDPVRKSMELPPLGPVVLVDTPGLDDEGELGRQRVGRALRELETADAALLVVSAATGADATDRAVLDRCRARGIPCVVAVNKADLAPAPDPRLPEGIHPLFVSAATGENIPSLREALARCLPETPEPPLLSDLLPPGGLCVLVIPIDSAAPKGRLILPQQQALRDLLDAGCTAAVCRETELARTLASLGRRPDLVVTDSQAFSAVSAATPPEVPLTSFSILFARRGGFLRAAVRGVRAADSLRDGDRVLICEGCTHHRQCGDIGAVKLPRLLQKHCGCTPAFTFTSGRGFPEDLSPYRLVVHCGGCMLTRAEILRRMDAAARQNVPTTNYGVLIAHIKGILPRSLAPFPGAAAQTGG